MKKLTAALICLCLSLCGCNSEPITELQIAHTVSGEDVIIDTPDTMYLGGSVYAVATCPVSSSALDDQGHPIFIQSYQRFRFYLDDDAAQQAIETDLQARMDLFFADAGTVQAQAREDCFSTEDWVPYYAKIRYAPARVDSAVISLHALHESYNGTAPAQSASAVTYDTATGKVLYLGDILEPACTADLLAQMVCDQLEGTDGLYPEYQDTVAQLFSGSISGYSGWYLDPEGLCFLFSPYELSPRSVQATIPYSMLEGLLLEQYLPGPSDAPGSLAAALYQEDDKERFSFIAELELHGDGSAVVIYPNDTITDLRIQTGTLDSDSGEYGPDATVFATDAFYLGNAVVIRTELGKDAPVLRISYSSSGQEVSAYVLYNEADGSILLSYGQ